MAEWHTLLLEQANALRELTSKMSRRDLKDILAASEAMARLAEAASRIES